MEAIAALIAEYEARTPGSRALRGRLEQAFPAGETRSVTFYRPYPVVIERGDGPVLRDVDRHEYLDVLNNYTALVHGHAHPEILAAARAAMSAGTVFPAPSRPQLELAELLVARYPAVELARFTNSGTEASVLALRIARRATGRRGLLMFEDGYHGTAPEFVDGGPDTRRVPFNDAAALWEALDESVAAVFVEPFLGSGGVIPAADGFLSEVQAATRSVGALFVLDEVQSLRSHISGVHGALGLEPDLVTMGKIVGGGFPVGAVGGRRALMELTAAGRPGALAHAGTFNGNPVTTAAGLASLRLLDADAIERLNACAGALEARIAAAAKDTGIAAWVSRHGSILHVHLDDGLPGAQASAALHLALLLQGVYAAPRGMLNLSTVLSDAQLRRIAEGYAAAFTRLAALGVGTGIERSIQASPARSGGLA